MSQPNGEETKICPRCGNEVLERLPICRKNGCGYRFRMSCNGCGRETIGRIWCKECGDHGVYHFQRTESLPLIRSEEENIEKFVRKLLMGRKDEDNCAPNTD